MEICGLRLHNLKFRRYLGGDRFTVAFVFFPFFFLYKVVLFPEKKITHLETPPTFMSCVTLVASVKSTHSISGASSQNSVVVTVFAKQNMCAFDVHAKLLRPIHWSSKSYNLFLPLPLVAYLYGSDTNTGCHPCCTKCTGYCPLTEIDKLPS